jgi:tRNA (guanine-N7-)-methyltransferase
VRLRAGIRVTRDPIPTSTVLNRGIRTFKPRRSRITQSQQNALSSAQEYILDFSPEILQERYAWPDSHSPLYVDIGFGNGVSTIALAEENPKSSFLAIDIHTPGVGDLLSEIQRKKLTNIRVMESDSIAVFEHMIPPNSLSGIFTLFPDPWPKARHHKRRIVQPAVMELFYSRLVTGGFWQIATDWQEYADAIAELFAQTESTQTESQGPHQKWSGGIVQRPHRPVTHYESRAIREGRTVTDFRFMKQN